MALDRIIASLEGEKDGPLVLVVAGLHGNEWVTVNVAGTVAAHLADIGISGRLMFARGNLQAIAERERYLDVDLNRIWTEERIAALSAGTNFSTSYREDQEQYELFHLIQQFFAQGDGPKYLIDLHASSSFSQPFAIVTHPGKSHQLAMGIDVPCVTWVETDDVAAGGLISYGAREGWASVVYEAGPLGHPRVAELLEACVWQTLTATGTVAREKIGNYESYCRMLAKSRAGVPHALEIVYQHLIGPADRFAMEPGFVNFQPVERGQLLGRDHRGPIYAEEDCHVLFPLYQELSDYGFLLTRGKGALK